MLFLTQPTLWAKEMGAAARARLLAGGLGPIKTWCTHQPLLSRRQRSPRGCSAFNDVLRDVCREPGMTVPGPRAATLPAAGGLLLRRHAPLGGWGRALVAELVTGLDPRALRASLNPPCGSGRLAGPVLDSGRVRRNAVASAGPRRHRPGPRRVAVVDARGPPHRGRPGADPAEPLLLRDPRPVRARPPPEGPPGDPARAPRAAGGRARPPRARSPSRLTGNSDGYTRHFLFLSRFGGHVLLRDGQVVAAAEEERFTRKKHDYDFPRQRAIEFCLSARRYRGLRS